MQNLDLDRAASTIGVVNTATPSRGQVHGRDAIAVGVNCLLIALVLLGTFFQLFGLPYALHAWGIRAAWLLVPIMLLQPVQWGLIHEAIHSHLLPHHRLDKFFGRLLAVTVGVPFEVTRFSHLVHHRFSRHGYDRADVHDGNGWYVLAWIRYWGRLFGGVYLGILCSPLIACIPMRLGVRLMRRAIPISEAGDEIVRRLFISIVTNPAKRAGMRQDFAMTVGLYGVSAWCYGTWWPMLLASLYVRGLWHSLADNVAHHAVELDAPERARNFSLPRLFSALLLNQNLHLTHHLHPRMPWTSLGAVDGSAARSRSGNYFRAVLRQLDFAYPLTSTARPEGAPATAP